MKQANETNSKASVLRLRCNVNYFAHHVLIRGLQKSSLVCCSKGM